jgi:predicted CxxxxCH...CXXCH cytochrome family protein
MASRVLVPALVALALLACDAARQAPPDATPRCQACHGGLAGNAAPPGSLRGATERSDRGVGAHQVHLAGSAVRGPVACGECHPVPPLAGPNPPTHLDGRVEVAFGALASRGGAPAWNPAALTCAGTYCHGGGLGAGGVLTVPVWTAADGAASACGACHGFPPPAPHPPSTRCAGCHPGTVRDDGTIDLAGGQHVDGQLQVSGLSCQSCHGGQAGNAAPPFGTRGETSTTALAVGAHQAHVRDGELRAALACQACHPVPSGLGHSDGQVELAFGDLARSDGAAPAWSRAGASCASTYCHGATLAAGGTATAPVWTRVDGTQRTCGACHGNPPASVKGVAHPALADCHACHPDTVRADGTIDVAGQHHLDGRLDVRLTCDGCHGAPPDTGAHRAHARPPSLATVAYGAVTVLEDVAGPGADPGPYAFGCGQCHPLDAARHLDGVVEVDLSPAGAPAGSLKARNQAGAAYDRASGSCAGVACHSSGQASPPAGAFRATPGWRSAGHLGCAGCHDLPPRSASGGPGAPDANSHLQLQADGYEWGHFGGLPGPWHGSKHGVAPGTQDAAPMTCQACHAGTVDPAGAGPSGFYWLNTGGDYTLPGGLLGYACTTCHGAAGGPPAGAGGVLALRHVNGRPDVEFDRRTDLPALAWLPPAPDRPTRPYWVRPATLSLPTPLDGGLEGQTLSLRLDGAAWDPASKTCSSVACHLFQSSVTWGTPHQGFTACASCHGL